MQIYVQIEKLMTSSLLLMKLQLNETCLYMEELLGNVPNLCNVHHPVARM